MLMDVSFKEELTVLLDRHGKTNGSQKDAWVLAEFLDGCLNSLLLSERKERAWYGKENNFQTRICDICGSLFRGRSDAITCSSKCRQRKHRDVI